ncbi:alpha/beta hydrolase [Rhodococcus sp. IEGM 1408]|uniref:alpha/beta hydrolase n=1 Tax=Rhodococcus sp. IEGM 1408 TaxID=3082220 RepID=UPI0029551CB0|nr:alpha/beta hydrolase [Rhodococcus sp. IEGM 1408]MDV8001937.1 alpha/beta hydrolase [Rhodococcus sp. IEGM 1408]
MRSPMSGHRDFTPSIADRLTKAAMTASGALPGRLIQLAAGAPRRIDGQALDPHFQAGLRVMSRLSEGEYEDMPLAQARRTVERSAFTVSGDGIDLAVVKDLVLPLAGDDPARADLPARLYSPVHGDEPLPMLIFFHGGGWVLGSIDSHDATCRYIARTGGLKVLSVDYRMAPEFLFPTAVDDAVASFRYVRDNAATLGVDPERIAVGGDSAGGNLAAVVCQQTRDAGEKTPAFQLLFVPATNMSARTRSFELFGEGFFLTAKNMDFYENTYLRSDDDRLDPRASPLLAEDFSGLPPAHVATGGFDPLRDEGEAYARKLADAGVKVSLRRHETLVHPFVNAVGAAPAARAALSEAVGALRMGLAY